jgi:trigger factor
MHIADFQNLFRSRQNVRNVAARTISVIPETPLRAMARQTKADYADKAMDAIIEQAVFAYPDALLSDQIHHLLQHLDNDLKQRGLNLETYMKVTGKTHDDLHVDFEDNAVDAIKRSLVMREMAEAEKLTVTDADIDAEIDRISAQFGEQAAAFRSIYNNPSMRENLENSLLNQRVIDRITEIARGQAPDLSILVEEPAAETVLEAEIPAEAIDAAATVLEAESQAVEDSEADTSHEEGESS